MLKTFSRKLILIAIIISLLGVLALIADLFFITVYDVSADGETDPTPTPVIVMRMTPTPGPSLTPTLSGYPIYPTPTLSGYPGYPVDPTPDDGYPVDPWFKPTKSKIRPIDPGSAYINGETTLEYWSRVIATFFGRVILWLR